METSISHPTLTESSSAQSSAGTLLRSGRLPLPQNSHISVSNLCHSPPRGCVYFPPLEPRGDFMTPQQVEGGRSGLAGLPRAGDRRIATSTCFSLSLGPLALGNQPPSREEAHTSPSRETTWRGPHTEQLRPPATSQHQPPGLGVRNLQRRLTEPISINNCFVPLDLGVISHVATGAPPIALISNKRSIFKGGRGGSCE